MQDMARTPAPISLPEKLPSEPKASILLVDDHPANLLSLRALLDGLGQNLVEARSGEEALQRLRADEFAVVLLDVLMPGIDGFETAKLARSQDRSRHTPIIFLTASDIDRSQLEKGYALGAVDFLVKPLLPVILQAKVRGFVELFQDKQRARREAEQLRLLVQGTADYAIFMLDLEGHVVTWNSGAERLKGYQAEEIVGQHFSRFYPPDAIERGWPEHELKVARAEGRFEDEGWRLRKDGSRFWANVVLTLLRDEQGNLRGFSKVTRDLSARKQAEEALRRSEERFRLLVEGARDYAIFLLDPQGHVASWNPGAERIKGYRAEEIIGQHFSRFYPQEVIDRGWPAHELTVAQAEGRFEDEGWRVRKDGSQFWANVVITALRDEAGNLRGFSKITRDMTDRKNAEENARRLLEEAAARRAAEEHARLVQEQRERLHVTLASIGDAVISTDAQGRVDFLNPVAERLVGWTTTEAASRTLSDVFRIVNEDTRQVVENPALRALQEGVVVGLANHTVLIGKDGRERPIDDSAAPIRDAEGKVVGSVLVFRDISDKKRAQEALRESEGRFRSLMEQAPFSIQVFAPDGRTLRVNRAWEELWGVTLEQIADYNILEDRQLEAKGLLPFIRRAFAGETVAVPAIQYDPNETLPDRTRHQDPKRWVSAVAYPLKDAAGQVREVVLVHDDITASKGAEAARRESEDKLRLLADTIPQLAWMARPDGHIFWYNQRSYEYTGMTLEQLEGWGWQALLAPDGASKVLEGWKGAIASGEPFDMVFPLKGADDQFRPFLTRVNPLKDEEARVRYWFGTNTDISDIKRMEEALREADRRKDEFLATLAHELRNPLAPIRNSLQILKMPRVDAATAQQTRDMMERQVQHLVRLVDDLLDVSRVMRGKIELRKEPVELATVIARAVETAKPLIEAQGHALDISVTGESLLLDADPVRLAQVVGNLLTNSAKYTEANGHLWLTARPEGDQAVLTVRDDGIGIAPDMLPHVFELFVQADHTTTKAQGGLGIGLTLVKNLVGLHGGTVEARSAGLGKGSEFVVRLPLMARPMPQSVNGAVAEPNQDRPTSGHRLLVVDDNHDAANSLSLLLRLQGHEVRVAHDGPSALEVAVMFRPDLIFLDLGMPGMDGYEVARRVRQSPGLEKTVLAALTGWGQQEDRRRTAEAGFDHHLVKPVEPDAVQRLLGNLHPARQ
jgi:PAS domain S-box-containing protein